MSAIKKALDEVKWQIPYEILVQAFQIQRPHNRVVYFPSSLESLIREKIIEDKVRIDCDLVGGVESVLPLGQIPPQYVDGYSAVYKIPKHMTQGRVITSVLSVSEGDVSLFNHPIHSLISAGSMLSTTEQIFDAARGPSTTVDANVRIIGENTVFIEAQITSHYDLYMRCRLSNDSEFSNLPPAANLEFARLVILATKAYIYQRLVVDIDRAFLSGGQDLGVFKEIVDQYRDAQQMYDEFLEQTWRKVALMADKTAYSRMLKLTLGGGI